MTIDSKNLIPATYHASTHPGFMSIIFIVVGVAGYTVLQKMPIESENETMLAIGMWIVGVAWVGSVLWYVYQWIHTVCFSSEGLVFCRFGLPYRILPWDQVAQVGLVTVYKATRFTIAITPAGVPTFDTAGKITTWYVERYRHKLILLDDTKENLASVEKYYGKLDYQSI